MKNIRSRFIFFAYVCPFVPSPFFERLFLLHCIAAGSYLASWTLPGPASFMNCSLIVLLLTEGTKAGMSYSIILLISLPDDSS